MKTGLEIVRGSPEITNEWGRCGLLCNQASISRDFRTSWDILHEVLGDRLVSLFGPQHGFHATLQDNMIESSHGFGPFGLPVHSLYSETREPTEEMLDSLDTIIIDIQIVGCRVYTFKYTIAGCLRAAKKYNKRVVVLDRPNPLGGTFIEGNVLNLEAKSFVGEFEIPLRHGLTPGEVARLFNRNVDAQLDIITLERWDPNQMWHDITHPWVLTSPNLPTLDSVFVYPATVMLEGTNLSEGRGTCLPFQFVGAPYLEANTFTKRVNELYSMKRGVYLRPAQFQPTSQKWSGEVCSGLQIHVLDPYEIQSFKLGLAIIVAALEQGGKNFRWSQPPYEYDYSNLPINLIMGNLSADSWFKEVTKNGFDLHWDEGLSEFASKAKDVIIYDRDQVAHSVQSMR